MDSEKSSVFYCVSKKEANAYTKNPLPETDRLNALASKSYYMQIHLKSQVFLLRFKKEANAIDTKNPSPGLDRQNAFASNI